MKWFEDFEIQTWTESPALCMRRVGPYGEENHLLMQQFKRWLYEHGLFTANCVIIASALDNPSHTAPEQCRYDLCFLCNEDTVKNIPAKFPANGSQAVVTRYFRYHIHQKPYKRRGEKVSHIY